MIACGGDDAPAESETSAADTTGEPSTSGPSTSTSGDPSSDTSGDDTTADSGTTGEPGTVELGAVCPFDARIGVVMVFSSAGMPVVNATIYDGPDPWIGPPELANDTCEFHRFATGGCDACDPDETCSFAGECVPQRLARTDAVLDITANGNTVSLEADAITGGIYGELDSGEADVALRLQLGDVAIEVPALAFAPGLDGLTLVGEGDLMTPESVDVTWTPRDDGSRVRTVIPINHHAGGPTFTSCDVVAEVGNLHADAGMLQPLATITGLEFQGLDVSQTAAAHTSAGCVEFRVGRQLPDGVTWP